MGWKKFKLAIILLAVVFVTGISGYTLIEGWSLLDALYMTVITIASVGYMEVNPLSPQGRIFTIFLIIFGMGILLFCVSTFTAFLVEGDLNELLRRRKMEKNISKLRGHYIVCGIGGIGRHIIDELYKTGKSFVAIDKSDEVCNEMTRKGILFIKGDSTSSAVLKAANVEQASGVFCSLHNDAENLLLILTAKGLNPGVKIVAKAEQDESEDKMKKAGADSVILPEFIGGLRMASEMIRPEAVNFIDKMLKSHDGIFRIEDILIDTNSVFIGKTLKTSGILNRPGVNVVAVKKGNRYIFNPNMEERLEVGDALILIGESEGVTEIKRLAG